MIVAASNPASAKPIAIKLNARASFSGSAKETSEDVAIGVGYQHGDPPWRQRERSMNWAIFSLA